MNFDELSQQKRPSWLLSAWMAQTVVILLLIQKWDKSYVPSQHFGLPPFSVETHLYSLTGFRKVMDMEKNEIHTDEQLEAWLIPISLEITDMLKCFWTCQSFGLILKILSVRTIKYEAEISIFCQSEWNFVSQVLRSDIFRHHCMYIFFPLHWFEKYYLIVFTPNDGNQSYFLLQKWRKFIIKETLLLFVPLGSVVRIRYIVDQY